MKKTMTAVQIKEYGDVDQLVSSTIDVPAIAPDEVLVKIHAASINPVDWKTRKGLVSGLFAHQLPLILGWDFSGTVVSIGERVKDWQVGDDVFASPSIDRNGSYAEFIAVPAKDIAQKPKSVNWQKAAAMPLVSLTAWQVLYEAANIQKGDRVLIHAGSGGVGIAAIQLAKIRGAYVYTTASGRNAEFLKALGADEVIDYTTTDFRTLENLDVVFDTLGGEAQIQSFETLKPGGQLLSIVETPDPALADKYNVKTAFVLITPNGEQLSQIASFVDEEKYDVEIDSVFSLDQIAAAHTRSETGRARGKIVIQVAADQA